MVIGIFDDIDMALVPFEHVILHHSTASSDVHPVLFPIEEAYWNRKFFISQSI
jgi:hypothetical protein